MRRYIRSLKYWLNRYPGLSRFSVVEYLVFRALKERLLKNKVIDSSEGIPLTGRADPGLINAQKYSQLICVSGFGNSGSGAMEDLLSEYADTTVIGYVEPDGSQRERNLETDFEFDICRNPGGLFDIEKTLASPFYSDGNSVIHRFVAMLADYHYGYGGRVFGKTFLKNAREFLDEIIEFKVHNPTACSFPRGLKLIWPEQTSNGEDFYFGLKRLLVADYRRAARRFLLSILAEIPSKKRLVLDMLLSDGTADMEKYQDYLGPVKVIAVMRDPRDSFAVSHKYGSKWMPKDVDAFINWYRTCNQAAFNCHHPDFLLVRFSDLALRYEETKSRVEQFLGLTPEEHERPFSGFAPKVSSKNVGLYRQFATPEDVAKIERELSEYIQCE